MPEHTLPDALHPQQEDAADELQLRGGLKGRFFADFCLLQSTVDALQNYLVHAATPDVQDMAAPLLEEMKQRIFRLERLADNAADLVAQSQPPRQLNWTVQEMTVYLAQLCDAANHELEECAVTGRCTCSPCRRTSRFGRRLIWPSSKRCLPTCFPILYGQTRRQKLR